LLDGEGDVGAIVRCAAAAGDGSGAVMAEDDGVDAAAAEWAAIAADGCGAEVEAEGFEGFE